MAVEKTDKEVSKTTEQVSKWQRGSAAMAKRIFQADYPEQFIRTIPAQSLYCVLKHNGLASSADLLEIATLSQCRLMLDFDIWHGDEFQEENFWEWLAITDSTEGLSLLQKLFKCFDLKLVALLILKYVEVVSSDEPTEQPPAQGYFTPDKGSTWINVDAKTSERDFLLNRLLALVFETDADLFYQLLSISGVATKTQLEEESYQDMLKRIQSEGIPDIEVASELRNPLATQELLAQINATALKHKGGADVFIIEPLIYDSQNTSPLQRLLSVVTDRERCEGELTFLFNSALVAWNVPFHEDKKVADFVEKIKGAVSIGIELIEQSSTVDLGEIYLHTGLKSFFRLGYTELMRLQKAAFKFSESDLKQLAESNKDLFVLIAGLRETFPCLCLVVDSNAEQGVETLCFKSLAEVRETSDKLSKALSPA